MTTAFDELLDAQWDTMHGTALPDQRFFEPTERFWDTMEEIGHGSTWIDCGTGVGHIPKMAVERGFKMGGCDIVARDGTVPGSIYILPAHRIPWTESMSVLVCRPNHNGWVEHLFEHTKNIVERFVYVGGQGKVIYDLPGVSFHQFAPNVGKERECMFIWERK